MRLPFRNNIIRLAVYHHGPQERLVRYIRSGVEWFLIYSINNPPRISLALWLFSSLTDMNFISPDKLSIKIAYSVGSVSQIPLQ